MLPLPFVRCTINLEKKDNGAFVGFWINIPNNATAVRGLEPQLPDPSFLSSQINPYSSCLPGATAWIKWTRRDSRKEAGHSREGIGVGAAERCPPSRGPLLLGFPQPRGHRAGGPVAARAPAFTLAGPGSPALSRKTPPSLFWGPLSHDTPQPPSSTCLLTQEPPQEPPSIRGPGPLRDGSSAGAG